MACSSCSQNTCNCTSTSICETCIDVTSSECTYYKGYVSNTLSLPANFRFNTFAEKVLERIGTLPANYVDYKVLDTSTLNFANAVASANQLKLIIKQTSPTSDITLTADLAKHICLVSLTPASTFSVLTASASAIPGSSIFTKEHTFLTDTITIGSTINKRTGTQLVSGSITFIPASTQNFTFTLFEGSTTVKTVTVPGVNAVCQTVVLKGVSSYSNTNTTKTFTFKVASGSSNTTINILAGDFEVREYEY
jgi:hypothetical protein